MGDYIPKLDTDCIDEELPDGWNSFMRFRLTFLGELPPVGGRGSEKNRVAEKWEVRRQTHHQLADLFAKHPALCRESKLITFSWGKEPPFLKAVREPIKVGAHDFIPLARKSLGLACELDITYLRSGPPGSLITEAGDLDNHMNTLFDGLHIPKPDVLDRGGIIPKPMYCLLEDDSMVTGLTVRTDRLLAPADTSEFYAHLIIDVNIKVLEPSGSNAGFMGD